MDVKEFIQLRKKRVKARRFFDSLAETKNYKLYEEVENLCNDNEIEDLGVDIIDEILSLIPKSVEIKKKKEVNNEKELKVEKKLKSNSEFVEPVKEVEKEENELELNIKSAEKLKELRDIAKVNNEFKSIRDYLSKYNKVEPLRSTMLGLLNSLKKEEIIEEVKEEKKEIIKTKIVKKESKYVGKSVIFFTARNAKKPNVELNGIIKRKYYDKFDKAWYFQIKAEDGNDYSKIINSVKITN